MDNWKPPASSELPCEVGRYVLHEQIGRGGTATVYSAELFGPAGFRKFVALKMMHADGRTEFDTEETGLLVREARLGGLLQHPHIVDVYELGTHEGVPFMAMELVKGPTLGQVLRSHGPPPAPIAMCIARQMLDGLSAAHEVPSSDGLHGVVHRDLKPGNVLLDTRGYVKIADFGLAQFTSRLRRQTDGKVFGTPAYMSPEQVQGLALDPRSDQYSFGVLLYELFTGKRLYLAEDKYSTASLVLETDDTLRRAAAEHLNEIVPDLGGFFWRCIQPFPEGRYPRTQDMVGALHMLDRSPVWTQQVRRWISDPEGSAEAIHTLITRPGVDDSISMGGPLGTVALIDGLPEAAAPASTRAMALGTAVGSSPFFGRERDLSCLQDCVDSASRLVTIKGPGGIGKTRLVEEFLKRHSSTNGEHAVWVNLRGGAGHEHVVSAVSRGLGFRIQGASDPVDQLGLALAGRENICVVLDNAEGVVDTLRPVLERWLRMAPQAAFWLTSRERLRIEHEEVIELGPMTIDCGVQLFMEHVGRCGRIERGPLDLVQVKGVVERLESMPLAIELAASQLGPVSLEDLSKNLDERLMAEGGVQTLRETIATSWDLLEPWEQTALTQLSVFEGGFRLCHAESVLANTLPKNHDTMDVVGSLYDQSLLRSQEVAGEPRFSMYVAVEEFARERLEAQGSEAFQSAHWRHMQCFTQLVHPDRLRCLEEQPHHLGNRVVDREIANLVRAQHCAASAKSLDAWVSIALARGLIAIGEGRYGAAIEALMDPLDSEQISGAQRASLMRWYAEAKCFRGDPDQLELTQEAVRLAEAYGSVRLQLGTRSSLSRVLRLTEGVEVSKAYLMDCLEAAYEEGDAFMTATIEAGLGATYALLSDRERCLQMYSRARDRWAILGCHLRAASAQTSLAHCLFIQWGRYGEALQLVEEALMVADAYDDQRMQSSALRLIGSLQAELGEGEASIASLKRAIAIQKPLGSRVGVAVSQYTLSDAYITLNRFEEAHSILSEPLALARESQMLEMMGACLTNLGLCEAHRGDWPQSQEYFQEANEIISKNGNWMAKGWFRCREAESLWIGGDRDEATNKLKEAWSIAHENKAESRSVLGRALARVEGLFSRS